MSQRPAPSAILGIAPGRIPLPKDELLHTLRGRQEAAHFDKLFRYCGTDTWLCMSFHKPIDLNSVSGMRIDDANNACNRTAPIFLVSELPLQFTPKTVQESIAGYNVLRLFIAELFQYTYQRWFHPYRSEVDRSQFLTKANLVEKAGLPPTDCSPAMIDLVKSWSANLCARVEDTKSRTVDFDERDTTQRLYFMQPSFRAVAVTIRASAFTLETSDISTILVLIVRTGIEAGLSAPINLGTIAEGDRTESTVDSQGSLSAVETTLRAAITFLITLEQREAAVFGIKPDVITSTLYVESNGIGDSASEAQSLGWDLEGMGPLQGPSSTWVDTEKCCGYEEFLSYQRLCRAYRRSAGNRVHLLKSTNSNAQ